jgi:hypothetical protein
MLGENKITGTICIQVRRRDGGYPRLPLFCFYRFTAAAKCLEVRGRLETVGYLAALGPIGANGADFQFQLCLGLFLVQFSSEFFDNQTANAVAVRG